MSRQKAAVRHTAQHSTRRSKTVVRSLKRTKSKKDIRKNRLFFPYPLLFFILLVIGVCLVIWTWVANADTYSVTAEVAAVTPTQPAIITTPVNCAIITSQPTTVSGTCPVNG